ncbi:MAG: RIP metalloprotease RseP [Chthoniobacterales bacterium]
MVFTALKFILICLEVVLIFNLLIIVHELGHFLAARWRGLVVEKFAIWFGKPLWKKTIGGVEYSLGSIPAGGFVALPQLAPMDLIEGETDVDRAKLPPASVVDKIIVAVAGPLFSIGLAFTFACIIWVIGRPISEGDMSTRIGYVQADGPAAKAGILAGDQIVSIDGHPVSQFSGMGNVQGSIIWNIARSETPGIPIVVIRNGEQQTFKVEPTIEPRVGWGRHNLRQIGIAPTQIPMIAKTIKNSPASEAGLMRGDLIIAANGEKLLSLLVWPEIMAKTPKGPVNMTIQRGDKTFDLSLTPRLIDPDNGSKDKEMLIGIGWDFDGRTVLAHPNPFRQIADSVATMWATLSAVASPKSSIKAEHLSGPLGIMHLYYMLFQKADGWRQALWFSVVLNVNLALLNMLPIPVLDGGHILLAFIEGIRKRPINIRVLEVIQSACGIVIIGFILYVSFFDTLDFMGHKKSAAALPAVETTPAAPASK